MVVALGLAALSVGRAWTGRWVPPWLPTSAALVLLVTGRRSFLDLTPATPPGVWAEHLERASQLGLLLSACGVLMAVGGVVGPSRRRASPALVGVGVLSVLVGSVWAAWSTGEAALWRAWDQPPWLLEEVRASAERRLRQAVSVSGVVTLIVVGPSLLWGFFRSRWAGVGESVAAGMLVVLVLGTGQPARKAVERAASPWLARCAEVAQVQPPRAPGREPWDGRPLVRRVGGEEQVWGGGRWRAESWPAGPVGLVAPVNTHEGDLGAWLAGREDVLLVGWAGEDGEPRLYSRHPVLQEARCRATRWSPKGSPAVGGGTPGEIP